MPISTYTHCDANILLLLLMVMHRERVSRRPAGCPQGAPGSRSFSQHGTDKDKNDLVENTLKEIRKRHSSTIRLSSDEIDGLLGDIRRSRSASEGRSGHGRSVSEGRGAGRPPPPRNTPPSLPEDALPFGRAPPKV